MSGALFISYRRTHAAQVDAAATLLRAQGLTVFVDRDDIAALADFPQRIRDGIGSSHAMLVWWSADYAASGLCLQELLLGWQHARRHSSDVARRIWIVNPEPDAWHIDAGELSSSNFLVPPPAGGETAWAASIATRVAALVAEGPLADESQGEPLVTPLGVPRRSNEFTGRGRDLWKLHSLLNPPRIGAGSGAAVQLHGLGGSGKTELAAAYVERFAQAYPGGVFWLNVASATATAKGAEADGIWLAALEITLREHAWLQAEPPLLALTDPQGRSLAIGTVRARIRELLGAKASLWIVDDVPVLRPLDARDTTLDAWRAPSALGRTLVTTRDAEAAPGFEQLALELLDADESLAMLARYRMPVDAHEQAAAAQLADKVAGHALALSLLGEQLRNQSYAQLLKSMPDDAVVPRLKALAELLRPTLGERARGIAATFERSVLGLNAAARETLLLTSLCLAGEPIERTLIDETLLELDAGTDLDPIARTDRTALALRDLVGASLLLERQGSDAPQLHALLAQAMSSLLPDAGARTPALRQALIATLTRRLDAADDIREHPGLRADLPHARHLFLADRGVDTLRLGRRLAKFDAARGDYRAAIVIGETGLRRARAMLGNEHLDTLISMADLSASLIRNGDVGRALALLIEERATCLRTLGPEHTESLTANNNLAAVYRAEGRLLRARRLDALTLAVRRRAFGNLDEKTLSSINNLGVDYLHADDPARAEPLFVEAVAGRSQVLGADHADTLVSRGNLLTAIDMSGRHEVAADAGEALLATFRRVDGDTHPDTLTTMHILAPVMFEAGRVTRALELIDEAVAGRSQRFGPTDRQTIASARMAAAMRKAIETPSHPAGA